MNQLTIIGYIGGDPEVRSTPSGDTVVTFSIADTYKSGENSHTEWFRCEAWNKTGDIIRQYVGKGDQLYVQGGLKTEKYTDNSGLEKTAIKVRVERVQLLSNKKDRDTGTAPTHTPTHTPTPTQQVGHTSTPTAQIITEDGLPF